MKNKKGQAVVEIALLLPILLFLICAILDFGRILYTANTLNMVSQEAVRYSGLGRSDTEVIEFAKDKAAVGNKDKLTVTVTPSDTPKRTPGDYVTVKISYSIDYITPLMGEILTSPYIINIQSTIRNE